MYQINNLLIRIGVFQIKLPAAQQSRDQSPRRCANIVSKVCRRVYSGIPYTLDICLYKTMETKGFQFEIFINVSISSFRFI